MTMVGMTADGLKKFAVRRTAGGWSGVLLGAMGLVVLMLPVSAAGQGLVINDPPEQYGTIDMPEPYEGGEDPEGNPLPPGCSIRYTRSPAPGAPCAFVCTGTAKGTWTEDQKRNECINRIDNTFACTDANGQPLPGCEGYDKDNGCTIIKGDVEDGAVGYGFFPHGHPRCLGVRGDPHLKSYDGLRYDLQAAGEFIATRSLDDNFEVQMRLEPHGNSKRVSVATAIALRVGPQRVTIRVNEHSPLRVDGEVLELEEFVPYELAGAGALLIRQDRRYSIVLADGTNVHADLFSRLMNV